MDAGLSTAQCFTKDWHGWLMSAHTGLNELLLTVYSIVLNEKKVNWELRQNQLSNVFWNQLCINVGSNIFESMWIYIQKYSYRDTVCGWLFIFLELALFNSWSFPCKHFRYCMCDIRNDEIKGRKQQLNRLIVWVSTYGRRKCLFSSPWAVN